MAWDQLICVSQGWSLHDAESYVKSRRPQAHPYIDCWKTSRARLVEGRTEEILNTAAHLYEQRKQVCPARHHQRMRLAADASAASSCCHSSCKPFTAMQNGGKGDSNDSLADWVNAEAMLIKEQFERQIQADLSMMMSLNDLEESRHAEAVCLTPDEYAVRPALRSASLPGLAHPQADIQLL